MTRPNKVLLPIIFIATLISACSTTVPVARRFPEAPEVLMQPVPDLRAIPPDTSELSVLIDNANENYTSYRILKEKYQAWQQWYREQKDNFDSVK
jgi:hypothetical protein